MQQHTVTRCLNELCQCPIVLKQKAIHVNRETQLYENKTFLSNLRCTIFFIIILVVLHYQWSVFVLLVRFKWPCQT